MLVGESCPTVLRAHITKVANTREFSEIMLRVSGFDSLVVQELFIMSSLVIEYDRVCHMILMQIQKKKGSS